MHDGNCKSSTFSKFKPQPLINEWLVNVIGSKPFNHFSKTGVSCVVMAVASPEEATGGDSCLPSEEDLESHLGLVKRFSLREVQLMTNDFAHLLGKGGFSTVAVKRLGEATSQHS